MCCDLKEEFKEKQRYWTKKLRECKKNMKDNQNLDSDDDSDDISLIKSECKFFEKS